MARASPSTSMAPHAVSCPSSSEMRYPTPRRKSSSIPAMYWMSPDETGRESRSEMSRKISLPTKTWSTFDRSAPIRMESSNTPVGQSQRVPGCTGVS